MADVLIIDSDYPSRLTVKIALKNQGFITDLSDNPEEALEKIRINHYNWILCDLKMGEIDPVEISAKIKEMKPNIKIILTSNFMTIDELEGAVFDTFIEKPINIVELTKTIRSQDKGFKDKGKGFQIDLDISVNQS